MTSVDLTYTVWKSMQTYLATIGITAVYYMQDAERYKLFLVLTSHGAVASKNLVFRHDIDKSGSDVTNFETIYKPTATLIAAPGDAVALAVIAGP